MLYLFPLWSEMLKSFYYIHMEIMDFLFSLMTNPILPLSAILTNRLKPSEELSINLLAIFWQRSFALVLDSTSNACKIIDSLTKLLFILKETFSKYCNKFTNSVLIFLFTRLYTEYSILIWKTGWNVLSTLLMFCGVGGMTPD